MQFSVFNGTAPSGFLAYVKLHLRITTDDEDSLLMLYAAAALEHIRHVTRKDWPTIEECPAELPVAALLLVADMYENREAQTATPLTQNKAVERLLWPHRAF